MAKDSGKATDSGAAAEQAPEQPYGATDETNQASPTIQEQADSVLSGEAVQVDHGQQSREADELRQAEEQRMADEAAAAEKTSGSKSKA